MAVEKWEIDTVHSSVGFTVRHMVIAKVHGQFTKWSGTLELDPNNLTASKVEVKIEAASIDTRDVQRTATSDRQTSSTSRERTPRFRSTRVEEVGGNRAKVHGDLTIRGVKRPVVLDTISAAKERPLGRSARRLRSDHQDRSCKDFGRNGIRPSRLVAYSLEARSTSRSRSRRKAANALVFARGVLRTFCPAARLPRRRWLVWKRISAPGVAEVPRVFPSSRLSIGFSMENR
jgi:polyisoprenoid-binding protein YceI